MRKAILMILAAAFMMTACEKASIYEDEIDVVPTDSTVAKTKKFTFTLKGDFSDTWKTRAYLAADGKDLTDVWVLDYVGGVLQQQLHQEDNTATDFGMPTMNLTYGSHHIYFVASRGQSPTLDTDAKTITWAKPSDTFYKDYEVSVVATSNGNRAVTLDRVITRFRATIEDAIPDGTASITIAPASWHLGWNYQTGAPTTASTTFTSVITLPSSYIGQTNTLLNLYGFSGTTEWTTNITLTAKASNNDVLGSATIEDVPFKANRSSDYTGQLFGSGGMVTMSLNSDWSTSYEGTW